MRARATAVAPVILALCTGALAGPLNPPAGPIAPTPGPEPRTAINATNTPGDADSVFKITQPGSYYLTGNVAGVAGRHGIEIAASGVSIDLNGFDLLGVPGSLDGVGVTVINLDNIAVRNGSVRGWGDDGIDLASTGQCWVEGILANANVGTGIDAGGSGCVVTNCAASGNNSGIHLGLSSTATGCSSNSNLQNGFSSSFACVIINCVAYSNDSSGISAGTGSIVTGCTARSNTSHGISVSGNCVVRGNFCTGNQADGIHVSGGDSRIEDNACNANAEAGIDVSAAGNFIVRNTCANNTTTNWDIAANNVVGPILNRTAPGSAAISGDSAPSSLGSADANANFTY